MVPSSLSFFVFASFLCVDLDGRGSPSSVYSGLACVTRRKSGERKKTITIRERVKEVKLRCLPFHDLWVLHLNATQY